MDVPFPVLTTLRIQMDDQREPFLYGPFLGGSAPRLLVRSVNLYGVELSLVHELLVSASDLVRLSLWPLPVYE